MNSISFTVERTLRHPVAVAARSGIDVDPRQFQRSKRRREAACVAGVQFIERLALHLLQALESGRDRESPEAGAGEGEPAVLVGDLEAFEPRIRGLGRRRGRIAQAGNRRRGRRLRAGPCLHVQPGGLDETDIEGAEEVGGGRDEAVLLVGRQIVLGGEFGEQSRRPEPRFRNRARHEIVPGDPGDPELAAIPAVYQIEVLDREFAVDLHQRIRFAIALVS